MTGTPGTGWLAAAVAISWLGVAGTAQAARPSYPGETAESIVSPAGHFRIHFVRTGADAVPAADADMDGTPDFVAEVASVADTSWAGAAARGFRTPLADTDFAAPGADGGDDRFDIYLLALIAADGHYEPDGCTSLPFVCGGFFSMSSDVVALGYPSTAIGIRVLVSHELFHAIQAAYDADQPTSWSEGTAVWNEEVSFPEQDDFESFLGGFLGKPQRPFERSGSGFGDPYAYGAAVWPTFLVERYDDTAVREIYARCEETATSELDFLDATDLWLSETQGTTLVDAWIEFTRWNLFTGARADATRAYANAGSWAQVPLSFAVSTMDAPGATSVEGLSATYGTVDLGPTTGVARVVKVSTPKGAIVAAAYPQEGAGLGAETPFVVAADGSLTLAIAADDARVLDLVVTGVKRGLASRAVAVAIAEAETPPADDGGGGCGCRVASRRPPAPAPGVALLLSGSLLALAWRRRRLQ
jgi:hypothetical protein